MLFRLVGYNIATLVPKIIVTDSRYLFSVDISCNAVP